MSSSSNANNVPQPNEAGISRSEEIKGEKNISHATGSSKVPESIQKAVPESVERMLPESVHPTGDKSEFPTKTSGGIDI
ncbi:hypothetical protein RQP46_008412 [Phenoliferia psychrophenolica]